jgi:hypothetical protein
VGADHLLPLPLRLGAEHLADRELERPRTAAARTELALLRDTPLAWDWLERRSLRPRAPRPTRPAGATR